MEFGILIFVGFVGFVVVVIAIRLLAGGADKDRVEDYVHHRGGKCLEVSWDPLGPGWFGEQSDRIYRVRYLDANGNEHHAHCKTSMLTGVYFTEDEIVSHAKPAESAPAPMSLEEENRRLREEVARLRHERT